MSWSMKADEGGTYEQPPTGPMAAVLTRIIDIGTHTDTSPQYGEQTRHQVIFMWELAEAMSNGEPYTIQKFYTLSMNEKANLRKDLESWRGKAFDSGETVEIDVALGKSCLLNVVESENKKAKIASISRLPTGMPALTPRGPLLLFRTDEPDWAVFEQLSEFHRGKIEKSAEYAGMKSHHEMQQQGAAATESNGPGFGEEAGAPSFKDLEDIDSDIPFMRIQHEYIV